MKAERTGTAKSNLTLGEMLGGIKNEYQQKRNEEARVKREEQSKKVAAAKAAANVQVDEVLLERLLHASGKHGFNFPGFSRDLVRRLMINGSVNNVNGLVEAFYKDRIKDKNYDLLSVPVSTFVNAFEFEGINKGNLKEYATGIFKYLISSDEKFLSQLKGKRLQSLLNETDKIEDARKVLNQAIWIHRIDSERSPINHNQVEISFIPSESFTNGIPITNADAFKTYHFGRG